MGWEGLLQSNSESIDMDMEKVQTATKELRQRIPDIISLDRDFDLDFNLYYWLKVGKFDVDLTEEKIRDALKWRKEQDSEAAARLDYDPEIATSFKVYMDGLTRSGFLAWTGYAGIFKLRETIGKHGKEKVVYHWLQLASKADKLIIQCNKDVLQKDSTADTRTWPLSRKSWLILNMKHLSYTEMFSKDVISVIITLVKMATTYFPSLEGTLCVINVTKFMDFLLKIIKPLLKGSNVDLVVFGCNEEEWRAAIAEVVHPDQIRTIFGGTREYDPDNNMGS